MDRVVLRVLAFESLQAKLLKGIVSDSTSNDVLNNQNLHLVDLCIASSSDSHHRVATEALLTLTVFAEKYPKITINKLNQIIPSLFMLLSDRRPRLREQSNNILNILRDLYDPVVLAGVLCSRINDIHERSRPAVLQYLCVIVPHCENYFIVAQNTKSFFGRLSNILGGSGGTNNATLLTPGKRVIELVYRVAPQVERFIPYVS